MTYYDVPFGVRRNARDLFHESPRNLQHVVAQVGTVPLHLLNTQGIWGVDGWDSDRRLQMADHIVHEVGTASPLVLAGDFNVQPKTETMGRIRRVLRDIFADELTTTFNTRRKDLERFPGFATAVV